MKICTITCHNALNHGARLQAYALTFYLRKQGHEVEVIDYRPDYMDFRERVWFWPGLSIKQWAKLFLQLQQRIDTCCRQRCFADFSDAYLPRTKEVYHKIEDLQENPPLADVYIAGSDQIWNTSFRNGTDVAYYLDFGTSKTKRVSYAASFATLSLVEGTEHFVREHLLLFDKISVREQSGLDILSSLGFQGMVVSDPVFLLSAEEWDETLGCTDMDEDYILVYDFMGSGAIKQIAKRLAKLFRCKIYSIGSRRLRYADKNFTQSAPNVFVELIRNARCVVSNSFHGTVLAMIYHRDFFVVNREDGLNDRMADLLRRYNLSSRMIDAEVSDVEFGERISYSIVDKILQSHIQKSKDFLNSVLL